MIKDISFCPGHFDLFVPMPGHNVSCTDLIAFSEFGNTELQTLIEVEHNIVMGFVGALMIRRGVYEVWLLPSIHILKFKKSFFKAVRVLIEEFARIMNVRRIQMTIGHSSLWKWATSLGFNFECRLENYSHSGGKEYLFSRCFEWQQQQ